MPARKIVNENEQTDTVRSISNNTDGAHKLLVESAERLEAIAAFYRETAASIDETL